MNDFKEKFIEIVSDNTSKYFDNGAASLLKRLVQERAEREGCSLADAAEAMSNEPDFGKDGAAGGVNVDYQTGVSYVDGGEECTWMTVEQLVIAALDGGGAPDWWEYEWTTGKTDKQLREEIASEAVHARANRTRFQSFGTGKPIVHIEYSYDENFMYEKCGNVTNGAEITAKQLDALNALHFHQSNEAAYIFNEASGGRSHAPI